jgi:hypothetical protein
MKPPDTCGVLALRFDVGVADEVIDEYARFAPANGAGDGREACACCACAFARNRASSC